MTATPLPGRSAGRYRFDRFELQPAARRLHADGRECKVGARAFDVLLALVERPGQVVSKDELFAAVWPGTVVEEANLAVQVSALRKVLGAGLIATVAGRGYQFTGTLEPLGAGPPAADAAAALAAARGAVPRTATPMVGRAAELASLSGLLATHRLVTVTGPGGIGKTRLAQAWCEGPGAGERLVWVDLTGVGDATQLPAAVLARLGTTATPAPLATLLGPLVATLVLDNAEPVADEVAAFAQQLLDAAPRLRLLVTSQVPLRLQAEQVLRLGTLPVPPARTTVTEAMAHAAVALFVERARAADPQFELAAGNVTSVVEICRRLDGLPLALELAAARVASIGVNALAAALDAALDAAVDTSVDDGDRAGYAALGEGPRDAPPRQRTLQAALEWSHQLLDAPARRVFRRLGVFSGGFTLAAAQEVVSDAPAGTAASPTASSVSTAPTATSVSTVSTGSIGSNGSTDSTGAAGPTGSIGAAEARAPEAPHPPPAGTLDAWGVMSTLGRLVEHSLVAKDGAEPPRFSLLESARHFALKQLARAGETQALRARHLAWCQALVADAAGRGAAPLDAAASARLTVEYANLRVALEHALAPGSPLREAGAALAVALLPYWQHIDADDERQRWTAAARRDATATEAAPNAPADQRAAQRVLEHLRADDLLGTGTGLGAEALIALARRAGGEGVHNLDDAVHELERAVALAAALRRGAGLDDGVPVDADSARAPVTNPVPMPMPMAVSALAPTAPSVPPPIAAAAGAPDRALLALEAWVADVLAEAAHRARRGEAGHAGSLLQAALDELERREAPRRARLAQARRALLEAALPLALQQGDDAATVRHVQSLATLDDAAHPTRTAIFRAHEAALCAKGLDESSLPALKAAVQLMRLRLAVVQPGVLDAALGAPGALAPVSPAEDWRSLALALARGLNRLGAHDGVAATVHEVGALCASALAATPREAEPAHWAALHHEWARALGLDGVRRGDPAQLAEALEHCRAALELRRREHVPHDWAESMALLASLQVRAGTLASDTAHLQAAVSVGRECLLVFTREHAPQRWATVQSTIAVALSQWAAREGGEGAVALRYEAVAAFRAALGVLTPEHTPREWAAEQCNLGIELAAISEAQPGPEGVETLQAAVDAYRAALRTLSLELSPAPWAAVQHNLGGALRLLGERESGTQSLREAALAFGEALRHHTRERAPGHWAAGQNDRALALLALGRREGRRQPVAEAVAALREALLERRRETVPLAWARTQHDLAEALAVLAGIDDDPATMAAAATAAEAALEALPPQVRPVEHANATRRLAAARAWLAARGRAD